jgi:hypothetical protein
LHIDPVKIPEERLAALKAELELFLSTRGRFFIYDSVSTSVELKDGSLKVYAGIAGAIYIAIGQYGSFRSGLDYLANDTKRLAECIVSETLFLSQSRHDNTVRVEARIGVVGSLKSVVDKLELTKSELSEIELRASNKKLEQIHNEIEKLLANLKDPHDVTYVSGQLCEFIKVVLPQAPPPSRRGKYAPELIGAYQERRKALVSLTSDVKEGKKIPLPPKRTKRRKKSE